MSEVTISIDVAVRATVDERWKFKVSSEWMAANQEKLQGLSPEGLFAFMYDEVSAFDVQQRNVYTDLPDYEDAVVYQVEVYTATEDITFATYQMEEV